jgi:DEAD_2
MNPPEYDISVRELAEFVHRRGDLGGESPFRRSNRALEGIKGHKRIQQSRGSDYRPEIPVERSFVKGEVSLRVVGRVDGIVDGLTPLVEEIKTVEPGWSREDDPVHWAQLRIYAGILALEKGWPHASLQLTYLELDTNEVFLFREETSRDVLIEFLNETVDEWFAWLIPQVDWITQRNASAEKAPFPFTKFRAGQRELARSVYRAAQNKLNLFVEAPTGMGKTLATLYPAIKALPLISDGKVFYVTAKTPGRLAAQDALQKLRDTGVQIRSVSLTAKAKICFAPDASGCDPATCPFSKGYYDRYKPAMRELLATQRLDSENISVVARKHQVCPFELSLDVSNWVDVIIGDYNYVFDPTVMLQRYFGEGRAKHVALIDEAHNLVDRSREMYSAPLAMTDLAVASGTHDGNAGAKARRPLAAARDQLQALLRSASTGVPPAKPYHHGAFAAEARAMLRIAFRSMSIEHIRTLLQGVKTDEKLYDSMLQKTLMDWAARVPVIPPYDAKADLAKLLKDERVKFEATTNLWTRVCNLYVLGNNLNVGAVPPSDQIVEYLTFSELSAMLQSLEGGKWISDARDAAGAKQEQVTTHGIDAECLKAFPDDFIPLDKLESEYFELPPDRLKITQDRDGHYFVTDDLKFRRRVRNEVEGKYFLYCQQRKLTCLRLPKEMFKVFSAVASYEKYSRELKNKLIQEFEIRSRNRTRRVARVRRLLRHITYCRRQKGWKSYRKCFGDH